MPSNRLAKGLRDGKVLLGLCNMYPASGILEGMGKGWDFVWIDGQHGQMGYDSALHAVQTARGVGLETLLRVPGHEYGILGPLADLAPSAIMVPMVNNARDAQTVVDGLRFPPTGKRSYGGRRVIDIGGRDYFRESELVVVAQIETPEAVENAEEVIAVEGIDVLFFGPDDMKVRLGLPMTTPTTDNELLQDAMRRTAQAAKKAGKACGCVAPSEASLTMSIDMGYQLVIGGADVAFLRVASAQRLAELRRVIGQADVGTAPGPGGAYG